MARKDAVPGGGATPNDADQVLGSADFATTLRSRRDRIRTEPVLGPEFVARINLLRAKLFQDPSRVVSAEFHLRSDPGSWDDHTTLKYSLDPSNPDLWSMELEDHERITPDREHGVRKITANFGIRLDKDGNPEGFAERIESLIGDSRWQAGMTVDEIIGNHLDARLGPPKPRKRGGVAIMERVPDEESPNDPTKTKTKVVGSMSDYEGAVYLFGKEAADEMEGKRKEKEDAVKAKKDSMKAEHDVLLERKARISGILNPDAFISYAELRLHDGIKLTFYNGDNMHPDTWHVTVIVKDSGDFGKYQDIMFGFDTIPHPEWEDLAFKGPHIDSYNEGVEPDPSKPVTGNEALTRLDGILDTYFARPEQPATPALTA